MSAYFPCTWEEALSFRREHVGSSEQAVRSLLYLKNQNQHQLQNYPQNIQVASGGGTAMMSPQFSTNPATFQPSVARHQHPGAQFMQQNINHAAVAATHGNPALPYHSPNHSAMMPPAVPQYAIQNSNMPAIPSAYPHHRNGQQYWPANNFQGQAFSNEQDHNIATIKGLQQKR